MFEQKQKLNGAALTLALILLFCFGNSVQFLQAQPAPTPTGAPEGAAPEGQENLVCQSDITLFLLQEEPRYREWMESHFNNKSSSGTLLEDAFGRYSQFRKSLMDRYATYFPQQGALQLTEGLEPSACLKEVEDALQRARNTLEQKARTTSTVKKTTALISKYQEINGQLQNLVLNYVRMKAYLDTFADKLPCYVRRACNKG